jgi:single-stranded-DNA-specific exonuclease
VTRPPGAGPSLPPPPAPEWRLSPNPDSGAVDRLARDLSLPPALCRVLASRGVIDPDEAKDFLRPRLEHLHPPGLMADAEKAAGRILKAVEGGETVLVHGDYDVDGVASAALLTLWIRRLGGAAVPFVPHRLRDGYDLGEAGLEAAARAGASLLVTCDSGIRAHEAVERARSRGVDVVITDHHTPGDSLPPAVAVVDPARSDCPYPDKGLCGAGVIYKLCQLLGDGRGIPRDELLPHLDLVALATVADLVPLRGENRVLVRFGLRYLTRTTKPGLRALLAVAGLEARDELDAGQVGFQVAPRINAGGRMGDADIPLRLLLSADPRESDELARELDEDNRRRREVDRATLDDALDRLARDFDPASTFGVVLAAEGWHPGVIGIVASRVVERVHRPTVLISLDGDEGRGSARSIPDVHLFDALQECREHFRRFGGHRQAAGMDLPRDRIDSFRADFDRTVRAQLGGRLPRPVASGDASLPLGEATEELHRLLSYLGPFGIGNPRPAFWARGVQAVGRPRTVGRNHLKLRLRGEGGELEAIGFGLADRLDPEALGAGPLDALFQLRENSYRGVATLQARLVDLRPSTGAPA